MRVYYDDAMAILSHRKLSRAWGIARASRRAAVLLWDIVRNDADSLQALGEIRQRGLLDTAI